MFTAPGAKVACDSNASNYVPRGRLDVFADPFLPLSPSTAAGGPSGTDFLLGSVGSSASRPPLALEKVRTGRRGEEHSTRCRARLSMHSAAASQTRERLLVSEARLSTSGGSQRDEAQGGPGAASPSLCADTHRPEVGIDTPPCRALDPLIVSGYLA